MEQLICKMCGGNELLKEKDAYVCQHCGCNYTIDTNEIVNYTNKGNEDISIKEQIKKIKNNWIDLPFYNGETDNKIYSQITRIGHAEKVFSDLQLNDIFKDGYGNYGCGYEMEIYNIMGEKIKYFTVLSVAYNEVEDEIGTHITRFTGPVESGEHKIYWVDGIWENNHISSAKIDSMMVEFFDGRKIIYPFADVEQAPDNLDVIRFTGTDKIPHCKEDTANKIYIAIDGVCHEEVDMEASKRAIRMGQSELVKKHVKGSGGGDYGVEIEVCYLAGKSVKSIDIFLQPLNSVYDKIGECVVATINGPLNVGTSGSVYFEFWDEKQPTVSNVKIDGFIVNFMDGTSEFYKESDISAKKSISNQHTNPTPSNSTYTSSKTSTSSNTTDNSSGGCYVATAVYGSYDCPQVWTLRRYRDYTLAETWHGRAFIKTYYAISPTLVKWFGHTKWFKKMWQGKLDKLVAKLQENGVESTPYEDKNW